MQFLEGFGPDKWIGRFVATSECFAATKIDLHDTQHFAGHAEPTSPKLLCADRAGLGRGDLTPVLASRPTDRVHLSASSCNVPS